MSDEADRIIGHCKEVSDEICSRTNDQQSIPQFEPADGRLSWSLLNSVVKQALPDRRPVFCELGSGIGLVTLLASLAGMHSTGIEIEEELFDLAQDFSEQFAIPASFINASIYPNDNPMPMIDYQKVDLFFAYPWPNQIVKMIGLFRQQASAGAVLVCYHGTHNYRVLRR